MKKLLLKIASATFAFCFSVSLFAQTAGTLTFTYTPVSKTSCYSGSGTTCKWVLAAWIENNAGAFVKTNLKYCCHGSTSDHLPTWSVNAGGTASNCSAANTTGATSGATLTGFVTQSFTWNGTDKNSVLVPDGVYKVMLQETWNHGSSTAVTTYTFTKGSSTVHLTPANTTNMTGVTLNWAPAGVGIEQTVSGNMEITVYPNPNNSGIVNIDFEKADNIKVVNTLGVIVYNEKVDHAIGTKTIDLSGFDNGIYFICVSDGANFAKHKVILNK